MLRARAQLPQRGVVVGRFGDAAAQLPQRGLALELRGDSLRGASDDEVDRQVQAAVERR